MTKYYFVTTLLPQLKIGATPELGLRELDFILKMNLTKEDLQKVTILRRLVEIENIRRYLQKAPLDTSGRFDEKEIEENLLLRQGYPSYVFDFLDLYPTQKSQLEHFPELLRNFFYTEKETSDGFVREYLSFEWQWRLVLAGLRAKALNRDIGHELRFEDQEEPFVQQILGQKNNPTYIPPEEFTSLKTLFETNLSSPLELHLALAEWRFEHINIMSDSDQFDIRKILAYVIQLDIVEKWLQLDKKKGLQLIEQVTTR